MPPDAARARRVTTIAFTANGIGMASWLARIPAMRDQAALDARVLGFVLLAWGLGSFAAFRFVGRLVERFGSGHVTRVATAAYCIALPLPTLAHNAWTMAGGLLLVGFANGLLDVAMNAQAVAIEKRVQRPIMSSFHAAFSAGGLAGAALGGLAAKLGATPFHHLAVVAVVLLAATRTRASIDDARVEPTRDAKPMRRLSGHALGLGIIGLCSSVGEGAMGDWSALFLRDVAGTSESIAALGFAGFSVSMTVGRLGGDWLQERLGIVTLLRIAGGAALVGTGLAVVWPGLAIAGFVMVGFGLAVVIPLVFSAAGRVPGLPPGAALTTVATLSYAGFLAGPPLIGVLAHAITLRFALASVCALAAVLVALAPLARERA